MVSCVSRNRTKRNLWTLPHTLLSQISISLPLFGNNEFGNGRCHDLAKELGGLKPNGWAVACHKPGLTNDHCLM